MPIEDQDDVYLITYALTKDTLLRLRDVETTQVVFRKDLVELSRIYGYEIIDDVMETEYVTIQTPLAETTGKYVKGLDNIVIINVLRATTPFTEGLLRAFPWTKQGVIPASHDEEMGMDDGGGFPITIGCMKPPEIMERDIVIVADPMLATGSTMCSVLNHILENTGVDPEELFVLSAVSASDGPLRVGNKFPEVDLLTVATDDYLGDDGYIVPGLGDADDCTSRAT